jgi:SAM-dependent MidA family methyltransferase
VAWARAAYGEHGFYVDGGAADADPGRHFRTSVHVGSVFHGALARLLLEVDARLGHPPRLDLVDVGAGRGELASGILAALPPHVAARTRAVCVEVRARPAGLDSRVAWVEGTAPDAVPRAVRGLLVAHELLDDVPLDVLEVDPAGRARLVLVDERGTETLGPDVDDVDAWRAWGLDARAARGWSERWWPAGDVGARVEVGVGRDRLWTDIVQRLDAGTALAIDYGHTLEERLEGGRSSGTLASYRDGRRAAVVPDGRANLTAHVAVDSLAELSGSTLARQRESLQALGVSGRLPPHESAATDPVGYAGALGRASAAAELLDTAGLGAFHWVRLDI